MRVVFLEDVSGVADGGDVKEVKNGFARNFLIPQNLAVPVSGEAMLRVDRLKQDAETNRFKVLEDMKALGEALDGQRIDIEMNAGASGRLYGSVTNAMIAEKLGEMTEREIDRRTVEIAEPIRQVGKFDVVLRLHSEVRANIGVLVYPIGADAEEALAAIEAEAEAAAAEEAEAAEAEGEAAAEGEAETMPLEDGAPAEVDAFDETVAIDATAVAAEEAASEEESTAEDAATTEEAEDQPDVAEDTEDDVPAQDEPDAATEAAVEDEAESAADAEDAPGDEAAADSEPEKS